MQLQPVCMTSAAPISHLLDYFGSARHVPYSTCERQTHYCNSCTCSRFARVSLRWTDVDPDYAGQTLEQPSQRIHELGYQALGNCIKTESSFYVACCSAKGAHLMSILSIRHLCFWTVRIQTNRPQPRITYGHYRLICPHTIVILLLSLFRLVILSFVQADANGRHQS